MKALLLASLLSHGGHWFCTATDNQGSAGSGYGTTRENAATEAILNCQNHSHGSCSVQSCFESL